MTRDIERGTRGISSLLSLHAVLDHPGDPRVRAGGRGAARRSSTGASPPITFGAVAVYISFTILVTEWRIEIRRRANELDSQGQHARHRQPAQLRDGEVLRQRGVRGAALRREPARATSPPRCASEASLGLLNIGQSLVIAGAVTALMFLAAEGVVAQSLTLGDLVLVNALLIQLYIPLNFLGMVYREIKQSLLDMDRMFRLLAENREVAGPARRAGRCRRARRRCEFRARGFLLRASAADPVRRELRDPGRPARRGGRALRLGQVDARAAAVPLLRRDGGRDPGERHATSATSSRRACARRSASCRRTRCCSTTPSATTSTTAGPDASEAEVIEAARAAHIHDFIETLPAKYETHGRRARAEALRRREAARGDRARDPEEPAHPDLRRGHLGARLEGREGDPGRARAHRAWAAPRWSSRTACPR